MKFIELGTVLSAVFALHGSIACAKHGNLHHNALERRHKHHKGAHISRAESGQDIELRDVSLEVRMNQCQFPTDAGLVPVTPGDQNGGWAMSPDQCCEPGGYCPYACPPGQVMAQWDPDATSYSYPQSMNGGLYCDKNGKIQKPFPNKPYCVDGTGNIGCKNKAKGNVAFCQTVLPGNEAMLIPTNIEDFATLAVPGPNYWAGTAAHFYINPPGISTEEACVWGSSSSPVGNWSPYVAGANTDATGNTFIKLAWNPIYLEPATPFRNKMPTWGVKIECDGNCNGLPCAIDPSKHQVNEMDGTNTDGAGGANFCVVTVPKGVNANFVVFEGGLSDADSPMAGYQASHPQPAPPQPPPTHTKPSLAPPPPPSTSHSSTASSTPSSTAVPTSTYTPSPTPTPTPTPTPSSSSISKESSLTVLTPSSSTSSSIGTTSFYTAPASSSTTVNITTVSSYLYETSTKPASTIHYHTHSPQHQDVSDLPAPTFSYKPHIFVENSTTTTTADSRLSTTVASPSSHNTTLQSVYPGLTAGTSNAVLGTHATVAGLSLTVLAAIAILAL